MTANFEKPTVLKTTGVSYSAKSSPEPVQGEEVRVVGVRISTDGFGSYIADSAMGIGAAKPGEMREPLMTVAQHNRIMAAAKPDAELVELLREVRKRCPLPDWARTRIDAKLEELVKPEPDSAIPPETCRQRRMAEGKSYPRSGCQACGKMAPNSRECDAKLATLHT